MSKAQPNPTTTATDDTSKKDDKAKKEDKTKKDDGKSKDDAAKKPVPCELTTAFQAEGLDALAALLTADAGYRKLSELGANEDTIRKNIVKQAGKKYPAGEIERAVAVCAATLPSAKPILDLPDVPDGESVDLDQPTIKIKNVDYAIPGSITAAVAGGGKGTFRPASDLRNKEWIVIAKKNGLTRALNMQFAMAADSFNSKFLSDESALVWKTKPINFIDPPNQNILIRTYVSYTEQAGNMVHASVAKASLNIQTPFCAGLVEMGRNERIAEQKLKKVVQIGGAYQYIHAILNLQNCLTASKPFLTAINDAVAKPTLDEQGKALLAVFNQFGHVIARKVTLGGQHYFTSTRISEASFNESDLTMNISAAVTAQYGTVKGGGGASYTDASKLSSEVKSIMESVHYANCGGDESGEASLQTTRNPNSWVVIAREDLVPLTEFLVIDGKDDLKKKVEGIWSEWLKSFWRNHAAPKGFVKPDMWNETFVIRSSMDAIAGRGIKAVTSNPPAAAQLVTSNYLASPIGEGLCWQLRYFNTAPTGEPVYFIEENPTAAHKAARQAARDKRLAAMKQAQAAGLQLDTSSGLPLLRTRLSASSGDGPKVICEEMPDDAKDAPLETNRAGWVLTPAEPAKPRDSSAGVGFYIRSYVDPSLGFGAPDKDGKVPLVAAAEQAVWYMHVPG